MPADAVAEVDGTVITKSAFRHWLHVAAVRDYDLHAQTPVPSGVVPDPPRYVLCVAHLQALAAQPSTAGLVQTNVPFKKQCEERYESLRQQTLGSLISAYWLISEGKARGLVATDKAVRQFLEMTLKGQYSTKAEFESSLANSGETIADQVFRAKIKVFSIKIEKQYKANDDGSGVNSAYGKFITRFPKKWAPKTNCRKGYVVPNCKQYRGKLAPEVQLL